MSRSIYGLSVKYDGECIQSIAFLKAEDCLKYYMELTTQDKEICVELVSANLSWIDFGLDWTGGQQAVKPLTFAALVREACEVH